MSNLKTWVNVNVAIPALEGYYKVRFDDGTEDEKPFRIRLNKNILGFMTEKKVTHWESIDESAPSALPTGKLWREVPVSERLPDAEVNVICLPHQQLLNTYNGNWYNDKGWRVNGVTSWLEPVTALPPTSVQEEDKTEK